MGFLELDSRILIDLKNNNTKECLHIIKNNKEIILKYLGEDADLETVQSYVFNFNSVLLQINPPISFIETVLNLPYFSRVYSVFLNSNILIEACKLGRRETLEWLLTLNINPHVRDSHGMTALMHASKNPDLLFVLKKLSATSIHNDSKDDSVNNNINNNNSNLIANNNSTLNEVSIDNNSNNVNKVDSSLYDEDNIGQNVLYYALRNIVALKELLKTDININHYNKNNETVLLYCCKNNIFEPIQLLTQHPDIDVNLTDNKGWTAAMYLAEKGRKKELFNLNQQEKCNYEYQNSKHESVLSIILKKMYWPGEEEDICNMSTLSIDTFNDNASSVFNESSPYSIYDSPLYSPLSSYRDSVLTTCIDSQSAQYLPYIYILTHCIHRGFNFNLPMDDEGNTPLMLLIIANDIHTLHYVLNSSDKVDISTKNKYDENAYTLALKYKLPKGILDNMRDHLTFDYDYYDSYTGNNLFLLSAMMEPTLIDIIIQRNPEAIHSVNPNEKENALILATKLHRKDSVDILLRHSIPIDYQDAYGNTALYYAIVGNDIHIVKLLRSHNADMNIKNIVGVSPLDYAKSLGYQYMLDILNENRKSVLFSFPSPPSSPTFKKLEITPITTSTEGKDEKKKDDVHSKKEKRKSHAKKSSKSKIEKEEVKDFYFQFVEEDNGSENKQFKEANEYIQPHVGPYYANLEIELPFELILAERKVFNEEVNRSRSLLKLCNRNDSTASNDSEIEYFFNKKNLPVI